VLIFSKLFFEVTDRALRIGYPAQNDSEVVTSARSSCGILRQREFAEWILDAVESRVGGIQNG